MNLSPLRKQVQSLNKDLQSQNIQIKDLIRFLKKSNPNNNATQKYQKCQSPKSNLKNILKLKDCFSEDRVGVGGREKKRMPVKEFKESKSVKHLKGFQPIKCSHESSSRYTTSRQIPMTKSVTFHNIHNTLTSRKYLKLSRPQKKINSSCSFCCETTFAINTIQDYSKVNKTHTKLELQTKLKQSKQCTTIPKQQSVMKKSTYFKSKHNSKQKELSDKKTPLKELGSNEILSKHEVKSFIQKKSLMRVGKQQKSSVKLQLKDENKRKNLNGIKR